MSRFYSERRLKLLLNLFPPLLFSRVRLRRVAPGFREMEVRVLRSILNTNFERSIFGGTIFSAADPFYSLMYWQALAHQGVTTQVFLKKAEVHYKKPALTHLTMLFKLEEEELESVRLELAQTGRAERWHTVSAVDTQGQICAEIRTLVHLKLRGQLGASV
jgi:acyl-coenzyme A thioesterase PaaI-like protein